MKPTTRTPKAKRYLAWVVGSTRRSAPEAVTLSRTDALKTMWSWQDPDDADTKWWIQRCWIELNASSRRASSGKGRS